MRPATLLRGIGQVGFHHPPPSWLEHSARQGYMQHRRVLITATVFAADDYERIILVYEAI